MNDINAMNAMNAMNDMNVPQMELQDDAVPSRNWQLVSDLHVHSRVADIDDNKSQEPPETRRQIRERKL